MPYTPNADDATAPTLPTLAGTAQAEFIAIKEKLNNLFLASDYNEDLLNQTLKAGLNVTLNLPAGTSNGILYGYAANITRNDTAASAVAAVGAQLSAIQGNNCNDATKYIFGAATEAWTSIVNSQAILVGFETSVISQYNNNSAALVGLDVVFKNRPDAWNGGVQAANTLAAGFQYTVIATGTTDFTLIGASSSAPGTFFTATGPGTGSGTAQLSVRQGLGANHYNLNSRGIQVTAQGPSGAGEFSGWHKGITFEANSISQALVGGIITPGTVIDLAHMGNPVNVGGYNNPWVAYKFSSALALSEYMSITWDKLEFTRTFLDSFNQKMWFFAIGGDSVGPTDVTKCVGFDYGNNRMEFPTMVDQGAPFAADASVIMRFNGADYYVHLTAV